VKKQYPDYTDPIQIDDDKVTVYSEGYFDLAVLVDSSGSIKETIVNELNKPDVSPVASEMERGPERISFPMFDELTPKEIEELKAIEANFFPDRVENEGAIVMPIEMYKENLRQAFYAGIMTITNRPITFDEWYENFIK